MRNMLPVFGSAYCRYILVCNLKICPEENLNLHTAADTSIGARKSALPVIMSHRATSGVSVLKFNSFITLYMKIHAIVLDEGLVCIKV